MKWTHWAKIPGGLVLVLLVPLLAGCVVADGGIFIGGPTFVGEFRKTEAVPESIIVEVHNGSGNTLIYGTGDNLVSVEGKVHVRAHDKAQADRIIAELAKDPPVRMEGSRVVIGQVDRSLYRPADVWFDLTISMPRGGSLQSSAGSGDQEVRDLLGNVELNTGSGDTRVTHVDGSVRAKTGSGDITARDIRGETELRAGSGDISAENLASRIQAETGSGDIRIRYAGGELQARSGSGSIHVREAKSAMRVRSSSGEIQVESLLVPGSSWEIETSSGDVELILPAASQFNLDVDAHGGDAESDFSLVGTMHSSSHGVLRGAVGQSSDWIRINSRSGSIRLRKG